MTDLANFSNLPQVSQNLRAIESPVSSKKQNIASRHTNMCFLNLLIGSPECTSLPLPNTGQREGGAFMEPCEQIEKTHVIWDPLSDLGTPRYHGHLLNLIKN